MRELDKMISNFPFNSRGSLVPGKRQNDDSDGCSTHGGAFSFRTGPFIAFIPKAEIFFPLHFVFTIVCKYSPWF